MVLVSSYFLASVFAEKRYKTGLMYIYLIAFAQVVAGVEFLSLFNAISKAGILILNAVILAASIWFWNKNGKPLYKPQPKQFLRKILKAVKKDKMLGVMGAGFLFFMAVSIFLCAIVPVMEYDSLSYHFNRAVSWAAQGSLAHFDIADDRNINMAINSEILYTWFLTFCPRNMFVRFFTFADYLFAITALSTFLEVNKFSVRKRLWTVFLFTALAGVTIGVSGVETNIMIGALALAGVCLFQIGVKKSKTAPVYFSSLALALAVGAKTSIFFMLPAIALILIYFVLKYQKQNWRKYFLIFAGFSILNFIIFASYNYVLNFLEFGSVMGSQSTIHHHGMSGGIKGYVSGLIRHLVLLLDFSGFSYGIFLEKAVFALQDKILTFLHIPLDLNIITGNENQLNVVLNDSRVGGGVIGVFVLLPCAVISIFKLFFCGKSDRNKIFALLAVSIFASIAVMSACIGFMKYSARFILSFLILASPILAISYIKSNKNIFKYLILFYVMSYFIVISTHISARHFLNIVTELKNGASISEVRNRCLCSTDVGFIGKMPFCELRSELYKLPEGSKIGVFVSHIDNAAIIKLMDFDGYKVDLLLMEKFHKYNLKQYDYLVFSSEKLVSTYILNPKEVINNYYIENRAFHFIDENKAQCAITVDSAKPVLITRDNYKGKIPGQLVCPIPYNMLDENGFYVIRKIIFEESDSVNAISIFKR